MPHCQWLRLPARVQGADFIECDVVLTSDCGLICRHEPLLSDTTNAQELFPTRATSYVINDKLEQVRSAGQPGPGRQQQHLWLPSPLPRRLGCAARYAGAPLSSLGLRGVVLLQGIFAIDLTLAEVGRLGARQAQHQRSHAFDGQFSIPTLEQYIDTALAANRSVGIYPEVCSCAQSVCTIEQGTFAGCAALRCWRRGCPAGALIQAAPWLQQHLPFAPMHRRFRWCGC